MSPQFISRVAVLLLLAGVLPFSTRAQGYRITPISSDGFTVEYAMINNSGVVLFSALRKDPVSGTVYLGVYKSAGTGISTVVEAPAFDTVPPGQVAFKGIYNTISINSAGLVALLGVLNGTEGVYLGSGSIGPTNLVADDWRTHPGAMLPTITDAGYLAYGGVIRGPFPDVSSSDPTVKPYFSCPGRGRLNKRNEFLMFPNGNQIARVKVGVVTTSTGEQQLGPLNTNVVATVSADTATSGILSTMNDNGTVVYEDIEPDGTIGLYKNSGTLIVEFGPGHEFSLLRGFALNNNDEVVFLARSSSLGQFGGTFGFFRGPNPVADKILLEGDTVSGSQLFAFGIATTSIPAYRWFNDAGQILFTANDGASQGLWVSNGGISPPEPDSTVVRWEPSISPPDGSFGETNNWHPLNGDPSRVPQKTDTFNDTALFDLAQTYMVDVTNQHAGRLLVKNGNVTFTLGENNRFDALSFEDPSMAVDNARLTLLFDPSLQPIGPLLSCNHALIGQSAASRVDVISNATWQAMGSLGVGGPGEGLLTINSGGSVTSGEARIGTGAGGGQAVVGKGGSWVTGNIAIGAGGVGELTITNGGQVHSGEAIIGLGPTLGNQVTVAGTGGTTSPSFWEVDFLEVGNAGTGRLEVNDGAVVAAPSLRIAEKAGATGSVLVSGVSADGDASRIEANLLEIGKAGVGELRIEAGAWVNMPDGEVRVGGNGYGTVTVSGFDAGADVPSELNATNGILFIGPELERGGGSLTIEGGGEVVVAGSGFSHVLYGTEAFPTEVKVVGSDSFWDAGFLIVGEGSNGGQAIVTLVDGEVAAAAVDVGARGTIRGFGTLDVDPTNRFVNVGGTISPGLSPGTLTINGSYEQQAAGRLLMEIGGTNAADCDHLIIANSATLDGYLTFRFINGFAPRTGEQFDFLEVGGTVSNTFATVSLENLASGFQFDLVTNGPLLSLSALNDGVFSAALPGQVAVTITNLGGITYASYQITTSNTCNTITLDGPFTRTNNAFTQALEGTTIVMGGSCLAETSTVTHTVVLGALAPGDYTLNLTSAGQSVQTVPFTVPSESGQTLQEPMRLADGSVQFQVDGLAPTHYTIEASLDLINWIPLDQGTLPATFTDFDAALFPQRFYRAQVGP